MYCFFPLNIIVISSTIIFLLSDSWFGRYKIYSFSLYLLLLSIVFLALESIVFAGVLDLLSVITMSLSLACYISCVIPLKIDQLFGASEEKLSFSIYWITWAWSISILLLDTFVDYIPHEFPFQKIIWFSIICLSFIIMYVTT